MERIHKDRVIQKLKEKNYELRKELKRKHKRDKIEIELEDILID